IQVRINQDVILTHPNQRCFSGIAVDLNDIIVSSPDSLQWIKSDINIPDILIRIEQVKITGGNKLCFDGVGVKSASLRNTEAFCNFDRLSFSHKRASKEWLTDPRGELKSCLGCMLVTVEDSCVTDRELHE